MVTVLREKSIPNTVQVASKEHYVGPREGCDSAELQEAHVAVLFAEASNSYSAALQTFSTTPGLLAVVIATLLFL